MAESVKSIRLSSVHCSKWGVAVGESLTFLCDTVKPLLAFYRGWRMRTTGDRYGWLAKFVGLLRTYSSFFVAKRQKQDSPSRSMPTSRWRGRPLRGTRRQKRRETAGSHYFSCGCNLETVTQKHREKPATRQFPGGGPWLNSSHLRLQCHQEAPHQRVHLVIHTTTSRPAHNIDDRLKPYFSVAKFFFQFNSTCCCSELKAHTH